MSALPERVRQAAELANQLAAKAKAGTMTFEDMNSTPNGVTLPPAPQAQPQMPKGFQPQPAGPGVPGLGTPGFQPQPAATPQAPAPAAVQQNGNQVAGTHDDAAGEIGRASCRERVSSVV